MRVSVGQRGDVSGHKGKHPPRKTPRTAFDVIFDDVFGDPATVENLVNGYASPNDAYDPSGVAIDESIRASLGDDFAVEIDPDVFCRFDVVLNDPGRRARARQSSLERLVALCREFSNELSLYDQLADRAGAGYEAINAPGAARSATRYVVEVKAKDDEDDEGAA
jgi:hypothetical protein